MSYDFVNNLEITDRPLTLAEMEASEGSATETTQAPETVKPAEEPNPEGLMTVDMTAEDSASEPSKTSSTTKKSVFQAFVEEFFIENGIDPEELDLPEITDAKQAREIIAELYTSERDEQIEQYKNNFLNPLQKKFTDLVEKGVTPEDAGNLVISYKALDGVSEESLYEDKEKAKAVVKEYLKKTTKFSEAKINKEIELKDELGTLEDDAKEFLPELKTILKEDEDNLIKAKQEEELYRVNEQKAKARELQDYLNNVENIGGFTLNKTLKEKWKREYALVEIETPQGKVAVQPVQAARMNNPTEFDALMRLYNTLGLFKFDNRKKTFTPDFSALKSLGAKETISEFEKALETEGVRKKYKGGASLETEDGSKEAELEKWKQYFNKSTNK
jgi:hypothetical protein